jgi:DNA-binding response OmpR family regulator
MFEGLSILYLEDEPLISLDTTDFLREFGFESVEAVFKLDSAIKKADGKKFDIVLLDINVGNGETSLEFGQQLIDSGANVMFASGNSSGAKELREAGFRFVDKPFNREILLSELEAMLAPEV